LSIKNPTAGIKFKFLLVLCLIVGISSALLYRLVMPGALFLSRYMEKGEHSGEPPAKIDEKSFVTGNREISMRVYSSRVDSEKTLLIIHGVHWKGFAEPRLIHFAENLARLGYTVVTPDIEDLRNYDLKPRAVDDIERSANWVLNESGFVKEGKQIGLLGISFGGGLCLSAANRAGLADRVAFVFSFGGHGDMGRTLDYLVTGRMPDGEELGAHIYGQAVVVRHFAALFVPAEQVEDFRKVVFEYLRGEKKAVRKSLGSLGSESRAIVELLLERDDEALGAVLVSKRREFTIEKAMSPVLENPPDCPLFLLHGAVDNVIPSSETRLVHRWASGGTESTALVSGLIKHVDLDADESDPPLGEYWKMIRFWTEMLRSY